MKPYIRHTAGAMDHEGVQWCIICGKIITDYRGAMVPTGSPALTGFPEGELFILDGFPKITTTTLPKGEIYDTCKP